MNKFLLMAFILSILIFPYATDANTRDAFAWLTSHEDATLLDLINNDFSDELMPDDPDKVKPIIPHLYKYIFKVGCFQSACVVLIGYREKEGDPAEDDFIKAFSYDSIKHTKKQIEPREVFYKFAVLSYSSFEPSLTPDIVFKHLNCMECESAELLASFNYEKNSEQWILRRWPENDPHILIGSDLQYGDDIWSYDCLFKVADITKHGFDEILVRCKETGLNTHKINDYMYLYTIKNSKPQKLEIRNREVFDRYNAILCKENNQTSVCK